jgi:ribonuclease P protein component
MPTFLKWANPVPPYAASGSLHQERIGNAVQRNRAKRLLREVFRNNQALLPENCDLLLVARPSIRRADYQGLEQKFEASVKGCVRAQA